MGIIVVDTAEIVTEVEQVTILSKGGKTYRHVAYYTEKCSGYDWYDEKGRIDDPDWAEDLDMNDIWENNQAYKADLAEGKE